MLHNSLVKLDDGRRDGQYGKPEPHANVAFNVGDEAWDLVRQKIPVIRFADSTFEIVHFVACKHPALTFMHAEFLKRHPEVNMLVSVKFVAVASCDMALMGRLRKYLAWLSHSMSFVTMRCL